VKITGRVVNSKAFASGKVMLEVDQGEGHVLAKPIPLIYDPAHLSEADATRLVGSPVEVGCVVDVQRGEQAGRWTTTTTLVPVGAPARLKVAAAS